MHRSLSIALLFSTLIAPSVFASPTFSIGEGGDLSWTDAINGGSVVVPVNPLSGWASLQFYNTQLGGGISAIAAAQNVQLTPDILTSDGSESHQSLIMSWENSSGDNSQVLNVAAWDYEYGVDPDLTGTIIDFSILPPAGVWDVSLELWDINGATRGWFGMLPGSWGNYTIDPTQSGPQGPFAAFFSLPGFDITQVTKIRLNESSQGGVSFNDSPLPGTTSTPWNAWDHLKVKSVPAPASILLLGLGLPALLMRRVGRKRSGG